MSQIRFRTVLAPRPAQARQGYVIYNAPRPIYGHVTWTGDFCHGIFYAAINSSLENAPQLHEMNRQQDAYILSFVEPTAAYDEQCALMREQYKDDAFALSIIEDPANCDEIIGYYLNRVNNYQA